MMNDRTEADRRRRHRNERIVAACVLLAAIVATLAIVEWQRRITRELGSDTSYIPKPEEITPEVLLLQEFVRIDTSTPAGSAKGARWIAAYLRKHGVRAELIESAPGRLNVYARLRGRVPGEGLLLFNHIDVVPPGDGWLVPPFEARLGAGQMWGRGTLDMKALTICQLVAFLEIARSGRPPAHDLVFLATADEETGSHYGMRWLIANRPDVLAGIRYGITEGGITEMQTDRMTYFGIEVGSKQLIDVKVEGGDRGAMRRARIALEPYIVSREPHRVLPAVREYFRDAAPSRVDFRNELSDIDRTIREGNFWKLPAPYRDLTQDSLWVSAPSRASNGRWTMVVKMSNLPDAVPEDRLEWLSRRLAPHGARIIEIREKQGPVPLSPHDTPLFALIAAEAKSRYRVDAGVQVLYRSTSDSRFLRPLGIVCYGVSPYPVTFFQSTSIHQANERIELEGFTQGVAFLRNVIGAWAAAAR